jgi:Na+/proline symporter
MFSATLSTLGNEYNVLSGILTKDFYGRVIRPDATEKQILFWGKINTAIVGSLTILFAIGINYIGGFDLWDIMVKALGALGPAIMLPLLAGMFVKKVNSRGALFGIVAGMISGVALVTVNTILLGMYAEQVKTDEQLSYWLKQGYNSVSIGVNITVTIVAMWIGSLLGKTPDEERARVESFFTRMNVSSDTAASAKTKQERQSPFMAVGIALFIYGIVFLPIGFIIGGRGMVIDFITGIVMMAIGMALWLPNRGRADA